MFKPVIHNLTKGDHNFDNAQAYNLLISQKPKVTSTLSQYIIDEKEWKNKVNYLLNKIMEG